MKQFDNLVNRILAASIVCFGTTLSALAAGGESGGGGKTVVCRNHDGSIRSAEILDLYEGRVVYQLPYTELSEGWQTQVREIFKAGAVSLNQTSPPSGIYDWFLNAQSHLTFLPDGTGLKPIDDSLEAVIPEGCELNQTVNYQNDNLILVDGSIWKVLSETQKAALLIHESTYRLLRDERETDSRRARHFTAGLVSRKLIVENTFPGNDYQLICESADGSPDTAFYALRLPVDDSGTQKVRLQFATLGGRFLMSRSYVDLELVIGGSGGGPSLNILTELKNPIKDASLTLMPMSLSSNFEPGDSVSLSMHQDQNGQAVVELRGTSIVDDSVISPVRMTCY